MGTGIDAYRAYRDLSATAAARNAAGAAAAKERRGDAAAPLSLDEYKREFQAKLEALRIHPSQSGTSISVQIADSVFEQMRQDEGYADKIFGLIRRELEDTAFAPGTAPLLRQITVEGDGAYSCKDFHRLTAGVRAQIFPDSYWEKRSERIKQYLRDAVEKSAEERSEDLEREYDRLQERLILDSCARRSAWEKAPFLE